MFHTVSLRGPYWARLRRNYELISDDVSEFVYLLVAQSARIERYEPIVPQAASILWAWSFTEGHRRQTSTFFWARIITEETLNMSTPGCLSGRLMKSYFPQHSFDIWRFCQNLLLLSSWRDLLPLSWVCQYRTWWFNQTCLWAYCSPEAHRLNFHALFGALLRTILLPRNPVVIFLLPMHICDQICFPGGDCKQFEVRVALPFKNNGSTILILAVPCRTATAVQVVFTPRQTISWPCTAVSPFSTESSSNF